MAKYAIQVDICVTRVSNCVALRYTIQANSYPAHTIIIACLEYRVFIRPDQAGRHYQEFQVLLFYSIYKYSLTYSMQKKYPYTWKRGANFRM